MNTDSVQELLQQFSIFKDLTDIEMQPILEIANQRTYKQRSHVFMQEEPLTNVYFIHRGQIKIYRTDIHGREQIVNVLQHGDMFPHQGFFRKDNYPAHAEVIEDALLIYIPISAFEDILVTHPEISIKIFKVLGDMIVDLQSRLEEKILRNTHEQIILLLLRLGKNHGIRKQNDEVSLTSQFTNKELANMIGSSRETVSRTLSQLKKEHLISEDSKGFLTFSEEILEEELF